MDTTISRMQNPRLPAERTLCDLPTELKDMIFKELFNGSDSLRQVNLGKDRVALSKVNQELKNDCQIYISSFKSLVFDSPEDFIDYYKGIGPKQGDRVQQITLRLQVADQLVIDRWTVDIMMNDVVTGFERFPNLKTVQLRNEADYTNPNAAMWLDSLILYSDFPPFMPDIDIYEPYIEEYYMREHEKIASSEDWADQETFIKVICHREMIQVINDLIKSNIDASRQRRLASQGRNGRGIYDYMPVTL